MRYTFPFLILCSAILFPIKFSYGSFKTLPITTEWTCSGCWTTNPEEATHCYKCGKAR